MTVKLHQPDGTYLITVALRDDLAKLPMFVFWQARLFKKIHQERNDYFEEFYYRINQTNGAGVPPQ